MPTFDFVQLEKYIMPDVVVGDYTVKGSYELVNGQYVWSVSLSAGTPAALVLVGPVSWSGKAVDVPTVDLVAKKAVEGLYNVAVLADSILNPPTP